jgi:hypothetical protein
MRHTRIALALLAALYALPAVAQTSVFPQTIPANTVIGRLGGTTAGPAQAIPFTRLGLVPTTSPVLGVINSVSGSIGLAGITSGKVTITVQPAAGTWTLKLPTTAGSNGQALVTDGSGQTSWAAGAGTVNGGTAGQLAYYASTAAAISGNANLTIAGGTLTVGQSGGLGQVAITGSTSGSTILQSLAIASGTLTLPSATDTLVARTTTDTLTNKTLTAPTINGGTHTAITSLGIRSTGAAFDLTLASSEVLTAGRTLSFVVGDAARTLSLAGNLTTAAAFTTAGAFPLTLTTTASTNVTLPLTGTLATLAGAEALTNKTYNGNTWTAGTGTLTIGAGKTLTASNSLTFTGTDATSFAFPSTSDTVVTLGATQTLVNKTITAPTINGGTAQAITNLGVRSTGTGAFDLVLANTENLTAQRTLTLTLNNAGRTINLSGNLTLAANLSTAGGNAITLTGTGVTNVTLPTSGTLAAIDISQTFSGTNIFSALTQFTDLKLSSGKIFPTSDGTAAVQITKADGATRVVAFDTTNARVGINKAPGAFDLDVNGAVNVGSTLTFATLDPTSLSTSTSTITGLTVNNSPSASNDYLLYYNSSDGRIRKGTVGAIAAGATAGVASLNGLTGGISIASGGGLTVAAAASTVTLTTPTETPSGRLTLTSATPITTADVTGATTIYYAPLNGQYVPVYNGTTFQPLQFTSSSTDQVGLSAGLGANWTLNTNYDWFVALDSSTLRLCSGPAWTSDTARGTGAGTTELQMVNGLWTNKNTLTCRYNNTTTFSVSANLATYVGTARTVAAGQIEDSAAKRFVWNAYNQVRRVLKNVTETTDSWNYTTATFRQANANTANQLDMVVGLAGSLLDAKVNATASTSAGTSFAGVGIGINSTTVNSGSTMSASTNTVRAYITATYQGYPAIGRSFYAWLEISSPAVGTTNFDGDAGNPTLYQSGISGTMPM